MRFGLLELWSRSKQSEEEATAVAPDGYTQDMADKDAKVEVTKVDMRKKENKPTKEDIQRMNDIMDSIIGEDNGQTVRDIIDQPEEDAEEAPF